MSSDVKHEWFDIERGKPPGGQKSETAAIVPPFPINRRSLGVISKIVAD
jgi:hypothetical protein